MNCPGCAYRSLVSSLSRLASATTTPFASSSSSSSSSTRLITHQLSPKQPKLHFSSNHARAQQSSSASFPLLASETTVPPPSATAPSKRKPKRKPARSPAAKTSLRRAAEKAQNGGAAESSEKKVTAICVADEFDMDEVVSILKLNGFQIDPDSTHFLPDQVVHTRGVNGGDIFVFPSGTLVGWSLPEESVTDLATKTLFNAAVNPNIKETELENLEFEEDPHREYSNLKGDIITLATKAESRSPRNTADVTFAKIAFSSGLARSTKLAKLETMLDNYIESTRSVPIMMSQGMKVPLDRRMVMQRTGQLLQLRAQLNHYSELTDSLPDLFWDRPHELGLESYYDQACRSLDVGVRIKTLNEKMDYAQEIASILRETMAAKHSSNLEWIIIVLIMIEVVFALNKELQAWWPRTSMDPKGNRSELVDP